MADRDCEYAHVPDGNKIYEVNCFWDGLCESDDYRKCEVYRAVKLSEESEGELGGFLDG